MNMLKITSECPEKVNQCQETQGLQKSSTVCLSLTTLEYSIE